MIDTPDNNPTSMQLKLYQLNVNKSLIAHSCLINQVHQDDDIIMIQEPYISKQGKSRATQGWITIYPTHHKKDPHLTRAVTLVNRSLSTNAWSSIALDTQDVVAMSLHAPAETIIIVNVYSNRNSIVAWKIIDAMLREYSAKWQDERGLPYRFICAGDWNAHHPLWDESHNSHLFTDRALEQAGHLLQIIGQHHLKMPLPCTGTNTASILHRQLYLC